MEFTMPELQDTSWLAQMLSDKIKTEVNADGYISLFGKCLQILLFIVRAIDYFDNPNLARLKPRKRLRRKLKIEKDENGLFWAVFSNGIKRCVLSSEAEKAKTACESDEEDECDNVKSCKPALRPRLRRIRKISPVKKGAFSRNRDISVTIARASECCMV